MLGLIIFLKNVLRYSRRLLRLASDKYGITPRFTHAKSSYVYEYSHHAVSDILGLTGTRIINAILEGERDCGKLADLRDARCLNDKATIAKALNGNYREEQLFILKQSMQMYQNYQQLIHDCDKELEKILSCFDDKISPETIEKLKEVQHT